MKMTGATILIKQGNAFLLGKVRHTGYDVKEFFYENIPFTTTSMQEIWKNYLTFRRKEYNEDSLKSEIITDYDEGFCHEFMEEQPQIKTIDEFFDITHKIEELIRSSNPDDGYVCFYSDYLVFVDCETKDITIFNH